jgi:hypothetical protein
MGETVADVNCLDFVPQVNQRNDLTLTFPQAGWLASACGGPSAEYWLSAQGALVSIFNIIDLEFSVEGE